jgi:ERCC4-type nuclease
VARKQPDAEFPGVILIDTREQLPFTFGTIPLAGGGTVRVCTQRLALPSGDYSLDGYASAVAVERKSVADLYHTVGQGRDRFVRELERLAEMAFAAVVVEGEWSAVLDDPPAHTRLEPRTIYRSVLAWQQRYPRVHWWFCPDRAFAEYTTFRILERFVREQAEAPFRKPKV